MEEVNARPVMASDVVPGLAEMVAIEQQMLDAGKTVYEVASWRAACRSYAFEEESRRLLAEGHSFAHVVAMWQGINDSLPKDDPDSDDGDV